MSGARLDDRGLPSGYPFRSEYEITPREAGAALARGALLVVDVRTTEEWSLARVPGAMHVPLHELESRFGEVEDAAEEVEHVAFLCHLGGRSLKAALFARERGLEDAASVAGGIDLWSVAVDASVKRYERGEHGWQPL